MKIANIDLDSEVLIIAEIGNNHEGDFALAQEMIGAAAGAGAGAVKFQTIVPDKLVSPSQKETIDLFSKFQFTYEQFAELKQVADREGVLFLSTPFDLDSVRSLEPLVPAFKIASGDNNFWPLIETIAKTGKPIMLSTGLADFNAIQATRLFIEKIWGREKVRKDLAILHCVSLYPAPPDAANLLSIPFLKAKLGVTIGFSDHTIGTDAAVLAVALGARIIEKHFTLDKNFSSFPDHQLSMDPRDLASLVERISQTVEMLGVYDAIVGAKESEGVKAARRSIVAKHDLKAGARVEWNDISWVRPGGGLAPGEEDKILGKALKHAIRKGRPVITDDLVDAN